MAVEEGRPKGCFFALKLTCFSQILGLIWYLLTCNGFDPWSLSDSRLLQFYSLLLQRASCRSGRDQGVQSPCAFLCVKGWWLCPAPAGRWDVGASSHCWEHGSWNPSSSGLSLRARRLLLNNPLGCSPIGLGFLQEPAGVQKHFQTLCFSLTEA